MLTADSIPRPGQPLGAGRDSAWVRSSIMISSKEIVIIAYVMADRLESAALADPGCCRLGAAGIPGRRLRRRRRRGILPFPMITKDLLLYGVVNPSRS